jgi:hypothetical protein
MATRSQQFRAETEREAAKANDAPTTTTTHAPHAASTHLEKKAVYAHEAGVELDHRSRRSTRKSANHAKTDATVVHAQQMKQSAPEQVYERSAAKAYRAGGGGAS